jgi:hypothetical protein
VAVRNEEDIIQYEFRRRMSQVLQLIDTKIEEEETGMEVVDKEELVISEPFMEEGMTSLPIPPEVGISIESKPNASIHTNTSTLTTSSSHHKHIPIRPSLSKESSRRRMYEDTRSQGVLMSEEERRCIEDQSMMKALTAIRKMQDEIEDTRGCLKKGSGQLLLLHSILQLLLLLL